MIKREPKSKPKLPCHHGGCPAKPQVGYEDSIGCKMRCPGSRCTRTFILTEDGWKDWRPQR